MADAAGRWPPKRQVPFGAWIAATSVIVSLFITTFGALWVLSDTLATQRNQLADHERRLSGFEGTRDEYLKDWGAMEQRVKNLEKQGMSHFDRPWQ